ncbi:MAG: TfoX/Sxy family protein [Gammaproteobacteria bacterium]|nr:TfoX/Sxy family protein [Gammaproteobacteria bacterium]
MQNKPLHTLKNIGETVASRLHEIGITNLVELKHLGSVEAYKRLVEQSPGRRLPVCYYLYSLEGAIQDKHWNEFSEQEKLTMRLAAGLTK